MTVTTGSNVFDRLPLHGLHWVSWVGAAVAAVRFVLAVYESDWVDAGWYLLGVAEFAAIGLIARLRLAQLRTS